MNSHSSQRLLQQPAAARPSKWIEMKSGHPHSSKDWDKTSKFQQNITAVHPFRCFQFLSDFTLSGKLIMEKWHHKTFMCLACWCGLGILYSIQDHSSEHNWAPFRPGTFCNRKVSDQVLRIYNRYRHVSLASTSRSDSYLIDAPLLNKHIWQQAKLSHPGLVWVSPGTVCRH